MTPIMFRRIMDDMQSKTIRLCLGGDQICHGKWRWLGGTGREIADDPIIVIEEEPTRPVYVPVAAIIWVQRG